MVLGTVGTNQPLLPDFDLLVLLGINDHQLSSSWNCWDGGSERIPGEPAKSEISAQQIQPLAGALAKAFLTSA